jgi:hypothetical protein
MHERRGLAFDPFYELIKHIKFKDTVILEMVGLVAGFAILHISIRSLGIDLPATTLKELQ